MVGVTEHIQRATSVLVALVSAATAVSVSAFTLTLDHQRVPTTVEGVSVTLFVSGPITIDVTDGVASVRIDGTVDLSDVQKHFASILHARTASRRCGDIISIEDATLRSMQTGGESVAEVVAKAGIRQNRCDTDGTTLSSSSVTTGVLALYLKPRVDHGQLAFDVEIRPTTTPAIATVLRDPAIFRFLVTTVSGSLSSAIGPSTLAAPLSREAASYDPDVQAAFFQALPGGALAAHLVVVLHVPLAKFLDWHVGG